MRDRIKELRRVKGHELAANPKNWRTHPPGQTEALNGVLAQVGMADTLLARETPDGLVLIDGHLRVKEHPDAEWPVAVLDVTEEEADILLASIDPLASLARTDKGMLDALLREITTDSPEIQKMLADLAEREGLYPDEDGDEDEDGDDHGGGGGNPVIQYSIVFDDEAQQTRWYEFLRGLKAAYPQDLTTAARILLWIEEHDAQG